MKMTSSELMNGSYRLIEKIGSGSFGNIYKGITFIYLR